MVGSTKSNPNLYVLLIGIDCYLPHKLSNGASYPDLKGAVLDIENVERFLMRQSNPPTRIFKLTASNPDLSTLSFDEASKPTEPPQQWPTYENIVKAFQELTEVAVAGDLVYIHYSGHGGRSRTNYPKIKTGGIDETLVPTDIGTEKGQYLRDIELAHLLKKMVDKELVVTVILDSCHSGGATRGGDSNIRSLDIIDQTPRPTKSLVAPDQELINTWCLIQGQERTRSAIALAGMLPEVNGYVLLAACRPSEKAHEHAFDGEFHGALTYWLVDALSQPSPGFTYKMLHNRIAAQVNTKFPLQMPMLLGEGDRQVFGSNYTLSEYAVNVTQIEYDSNSQPKRVKLNAGQAQGLLKEAEFAIYRPGTTNFQQKEQRLAIAEITERQGNYSWAEITKILNFEVFIQEGVQAVLASIPIKFRKKVRLLTDREFSSGRGKALQEIETALVGNGRVRLISNEETADFQVDVKQINWEEAAIYQLAVNEVIYEICDPSGVPIILRPAVRVNDSKASIKVVNRLVHLAKYQAAQAIHNHDPISPLQGKIVFELLGKQTDYQRGDAPEPEPFDDPNDPTVTEGEYLFLKIRNNYSGVFNFAVLNLESNWRIRQVAPESSSYTPLDPKEETILPFRMTLPPDAQKEGVDIFKVFATVGDANFRWLELPLLDEPEQSRGFRSPSNQLEELLAAFAADNPPRSGTLVTSPSHEWMTTQVTVKVISGCA